MVGRRGVVGAGAALCLLSAYSSVVQAASSPVPCVYVNVTPAWATRQVIGCAGYRNNRLVVSTSTDGARTWASNEAVGTPDGVDALVSILVSPRYDADRTIYLRYQGLGVFAATDGRTFAAADAQGGTEAGDSLTVIERFGPSIDAVRPEPALVLAKRRSGVLYRGQHVPVTGSGNRQDRAFFQIGSGPGAGIVNVSEGLDSQLAFHTRLSTCTWELSCLEGTNLPGTVWFEAFAVDPSATQRTALILARQPGGRPALWSTFDRGKTFSRNAAFDNKIAELARRSPHMGGAHGVAVMPGGNTWVVHAVVGEGHLLISQDRGRSWRAIAGPPRRVQLASLPDGRLLAGSASFQCSTDLGRRWHSVCPR